MTEGAEESSFPGPTQLPVDPPAPPRLPGRELAQFPEIPPSRFLMLLLALRREVVGRDRSWESPDLTE